MTSKGSLQLKLFYNFNVFSLTFIYDKVLPSKVSFGNNDCEFVHHFQMQLKILYV